MIGLWLYEKTTRSHSLLRTVQTYNTKQRKHIIYFTFTKARLCTCSTDWRFVSGIEDRNLTACTSSSTTARVKNSLLRSWNISTDRYGVSFTYHEQNSQSLLTFSSMENTLKKITSSNIHHNEQLRNFLVKRVFARNYSHENDFRLQYRFIFI